MLTEVDALPGAGMTGGTTGKSIGTPVGGVVAIGTGTSAVVTGAVGELPPPHWLNTIALPSMRAIPNTGRKPECMCETV